ncbi:MAG: riboflavin kinase [Patescibacteria group bacterium]|nr:riboflavin kinase [Patescibacteria group bacterium]
MFRPITTYISRTTYTACVISGSQNGQKIGFPTLNLVIPKNFTEPHGIYAGWVYINTVRYRGAFHYGPIPVFQKKDSSLEVFVLDANLTSPPAQISFELVGKIRAIENFTDTDALKEQITQDVSAVRIILQ